jgi:hypothetical protein
VVRQEHPIRIAITVGVVAWWMLRGRSTPTYYGASDTSWDQDEYGPTEPGSARQGRRDGVDGA